MASPFLPSDLATARWVTDEVESVELGSTEDSPAMALSSMSIFTKCIDALDEMMIFAEVGDIEMRDHVPDESSSMATIRLPIDGRLDSLDGIGTFSPVSVFVDMNDANPAVEGHAERPYSNLLPETHPKVKPDVVNYATSADWETKRVLIQYLYMDQNLNLQDIMEIMKQRHNFHATPKMYKSRFSKWQLRKYNRIRHPHHPQVQGRKSCLRQTDLRMKALLHESTTAQLKEEALAVLLHLFRPVAPNKWLLASVGYEATKCVGCAMRYIDDGNTAVGFAYARRVFVSMELALQSLDGPVAFDLIVKTLAKLLYWEQEDILTRYLSHMAKLSAAMRTRHSLGQVASTLLELHKSGSHHLRHFVASAFDIMDDILAQPSIGSTSKPLIYLRISCARSKRLLNVWNGDMHWTVSQASAQYDEYIEKAVAIGGEACREALDLELDRLQVQYLNSVYLDDFFARSQRVLEFISDEYEGAELPNSDWMPSDAKVFMTCGTTLAVVSLENEMNEADFVLSWLGKLFKSGTRISTDIALFHEIESLLRLRGLTDEADKLAELLFTASSTFSPSIKSVVEEFGGMKLNGGED